jgi:hypothetical protein
MVRVPHGGGSWNYGTGVSFLWIRVRRYSSKCEMKDCGEFISFRRLSLTSYTSCVKITKPAKSAIDKDQNPRRPVCP